MRKKIGHSVWVAAMVAIFAISGSGMTLAQTPAGPTADRATHITDTVELRLQSGSNFIRVESKYLPATITYRPDTAFGPLPVALVLNDTLEANVIFEDCHMGWRWKLAEAANSQIMEIKAHESASIIVEPKMCRPVAIDTGAVVCEGIYWEGLWREKSGDYLAKYITSEGCDSIRRLHLVVNTPHAPVDTFVDVWDSIKWFGKIYKEAGSYPVQIEDENGCDYTYTLHLTVHQTKYNLVYEHACDSFVLNGKRYEKEGVYVIDTTMLASGDRRINSMQLSFGHTKYASKVDTACVTYLAASGTKYTESGVYNDTTHQPDGCDLVTQLKLHIIPDCTKYDTVYFCAGVNPEHADTITEGYVRLFKNYLYQSPKEWDYWYGVILDKEPGRSLMDLSRAEKNLRKHYVGELTPIQSVNWSYRPWGASAYQPLEVEGGPQWIDAGVVVMQVHFLCGQTFTTDYTTDVEKVEAADPMSGRKMLIDGQIYILRGGERYTILGTKVE